MTLETKMMEKQLQIILTGSIFVEDAQETKETLTTIIDEGNIDFLIDLSRVDYIDSSGLGMLVSVNKLAVKKGGGVIIKGLQGIVKELFELTRMNRVFEIQ